MNALRYIPIPRVGSGRYSCRFGFSHRLYAGPDHLLIVQSSGYTEHYKRIRYDKIRYLIARENQNQIWMAVIAGSFTLLFGALGLLTRFSYAGYICAVPFLIWLIINLARGPMCTCFLNTAVQTIKLPHPLRLNRVKYLDAFIKAKLAEISSAPPGNVPL